MLSNIRKTLIDILVRRMPERDVNEIAKKWGYKVQRAEPVAVEYWNTKMGTIVTKDDSVVTSSEAPDSGIEVAAPLAPPKDLHSVFGELIADLGYKRVYLCCVCDLVTAPVWERQRILRPERAARIAQSKLQDSRGQPLWLSGVITMFFNPLTEECGIIDGQHRAAALMMLAQKGKWEETKRNIVIDVFTIENDEQISALFKEINSAEPVKLVDMPGEGLSDDAKAILDEAIDALGNKYHEMFKLSHRCRPPHLNADVLRDDIFQADIMNRHNIKSTQQLLQHLEKLNTDLANIDVSKYSPFVIQKARANGFYLGLDKSWLQA